MKLHVQEYVKFARYERPRKLTVLKSSLKDLHEANPDFEKLLGKLILFHDYSEKPASLQRDASFRVSRCGGSASAAGVQTRSGRRPQVGPPARVTAAPARYRDPAPGPRAHSGACPGPAPAGNGKRRVGGSLARAAPPRRRRTPIATAECERTSLQKYPRSTICRGDGKPERRSCERGVRPPSQRR